MEKEKDIAAEEIIREPIRKRRTGVSRVQWWRLERRGEAPKRVQLGPNSVGWLNSEIDGWIKARAEARAALRKFSVAFLAAIGIGAYFLVA